MFSCPVECSLLGEEREVNWRFIAASSFKWEFEVFEDLSWVEVEKFQVRWNSHGIQTKQEPSSDFSSEFLCSNLQGCYALKAETRPAKDHRKNSTDNRQQIEIDMQLSQSLSWIKIRVGIGRQSQARSADAF
jgi:hypothetical protein